MSGTSAGHGRGTTVFFHTFTLSCPSLCKSSSSENSHWDHFFQCRFRGSETVQQHNLNSAQTRRTSRFVPVNRRGSPGRAATEASGPFSLSSPPAAAQQSAVCLQCTLIKVELPQSNPPTPPLAPPRPSRPHPVLPGGAVWNVCCCQPPVCIQLFSNETVTHSTSTAQIFIWWWRSTIKNKHLTKEGGRVGAVNSICREGPSTRLWTSDH